MKAYETKGNIDLAQMRNKKDHDKNFCKEKKYNFCKYDY